MRKRNFLMAAGACLAALALIAPTAIAEPTGLPATRILAGGGSDTTQDVMNSLSNLLADGARVIGSYDATGTPILSPTKIDDLTTPDVDCDDIARPVGSTNGVRALRDQRAAAAAAVPIRRPCLDWARSSTDSSQLGEFAGTGLSYVVLAGDSISYATRRDSAIPPTLTVLQLQAIYLCTAPATQGPNPAIRPLLPQAGSGTRLDWLRALRRPADSPLTGLPPGPCVSDRDPTVPDGSVGLIENTGNRLTLPQHLAPYGNAQYQSQFYDVITDVRGTTEIRRIAGIPPTALTFPIQREVFTVVPTSEIDAADPSVLATFIGPGSAVCTPAADAVVAAQFFIPSPDCGVIRSQTPGGPGISLPGPVR